MHKTKRDIHKPLDLDPFQNMIMRPNRSPLLKPAVVSSRANLKVSRSAGSLREKFKLPPVNSLKETQNINFSAGLSRENLKTPSFKITTSLSERTQIRYSKSKPPIPRKFPWKKLDENECQTINLNNEVSFGDIDENCLQVIKKFVLK